MPARVVIYHLAGSKLNQVEEFAADAFTEITIGRDPGATIRFDAAGGDGVSPHHARIKVSGDPPRLLLSDCGSHRGTLLNGNKIDTENEIFAGDEIELGADGPRFVVDWAAEASSQSPRKIRLPNALEPAKNALVPVQPITAVPAIISGKRSGGGGLVVQAPQAAVRSPRRAVVYGLLGLLVLIAMVTGTAYTMSEPAPRLLAAPASSATVEPAPAGVAAEIAPVAKPPAVTFPPPALPETKVAAPLPPAASSIGPPGAGIAERKPDLSGTVRKIAGASRFRVQEQWIELYGVDDPTIKGEHNQAVYEYLKPFAGVIQCYAKAYGRFECFGGGQNLAIVAIRRGFVRLTSDAPSEYYALVQRMAAER